MFGDHVSQKLSAYHDGELPPPDVRRVAEHLLHCQRCRKEYEEINFGSHLAARLAPFRAPESMWNEVEAALDRLDEMKPAGRVHRGPTVDAGGTRWRSVFAPGSLRFAAGVIALLLLSVSVVLWGSRRHPHHRPPDNPQAVAWRVTKLEGQPKIGEQEIGQTDRLGVGEWLVTDEGSRAQISIGEIGEVRVEPNSRIRLVRAREDEHRLAIPRGKMQAFIWAPPRQFFVDTPSAVAVDLGCSYTLEVNDDGQGLLRVTSGWVAFEWKGRESFVPAEAECVTRPLSGPGTPHFSDASREFQDSLAIFDTMPSGDRARGSVVEVILSRARRKDALTLWHLLTRAEESERGRVYERLAELVPPPRPVTREGILRGDRAMIDAWWDQLDLGDTGWWRMWKGPVPSPSK